MPSDTSRPSQRRKVNGVEPDSHQALDYARLFRELADARGDVALTYDDAPAVHELAENSGFEATEVPMKSDHNRVMRELCIGDRRVELVD